MNCFKVSIIIASLGLSAVSFTSPLAQAIWCSSAYSNFSTFLTSTGSGSIVTHQPRTLDVRGSMGNSCQPFGESIPYGTGATHGYSGYVRVKWIGESPPDTETEYEAKFDVWSIRNSTANSALIGNGPGNRTLRSEVSVVDTFVSSLIVGVTKNFPTSGSAPPASGGDHIGTGLNSVALPTSTTDGNWTYYGDYVSGAIFSWDTNGYYANVYFIGSSAWQLTFSGSPGSNYPYWDSRDIASVSSGSRIIFKLATVAGEAVSE
jgi:hypothetical protein